MNMNATLIGQTVTFIVFIWICMKYIWPPITAAMAARQKAIADGLSAAERASQDLDLAQKRAADQLREAKEQAAALVEEARQRALAFEDEQKEKAREEAAKILEAARAEIETETNRAKDALRAQVAALAVEGAERILEKSVDEQAHSDMLGKLAAQL